MVYGNFVSISDYMVFKSIESPLRAPAGAKILIVTWVGNRYPECKAYVRFIDLDTREQVDVWEFIFRQNSLRGDWWYEIMPNRDWHLRGEVGRIIDNEYHPEASLDFTIYLFERPPTLNFMPFLIGGALLLVGLPLLIKKKK